MGYLILVPVIRTIHKQRVFTGLAEVPGKKIETITIQKGTEQLILKPGKRELLYKGCMYDILSSVDDGCRITYSCLRDFKEDKLNQISRQLTGEQNAKSPPARALHNILEGIIKIAILNDKVSLHILNIAFRWISPPVLRYYDPLLSVLGHPPKIQ